MRVTEFYIHTLREAPSDAQIHSDRLLRRGGFIRPVAAGVFNYLPLGYIVLARIEQIVREEMNGAGAVELFMPVMQPRELWERSGRWDTFEPQPLRFKDRTGREFCMGPTHEEVITTLVADDITSYKQLPVTLYQIQTKFRDELRPRGGLIRVKEFSMKDAYSFDLDRAGIDISYDKMYEAYVRIFDRCGLQVEVVLAEAGSMGGFDTREFMLICENGEDTVFKCDSCEYASNAECASSRAPQPLPPGDATGTRELVDTPGAKTIEAVTKMLNTTADRLVKTLLCRAGDKFVAALVRGDRDLNEAKLAAYLQTEDLRMANDEEVERLTGAEVGYAGPIGLPEERPYRRCKHRCGLPARRLHRPAIRGCRRSVHEVCRRTAAGLPRHRACPYLQTRHQVLRSARGARAGRERRAATDGYGLLRHRGQSHDRRDCGTVT